MLNFFLAEFLSKSKKQDDNILKKYYLKAIKANPYNVEALVSLSRLYFKHKNREKAEKFVTRAIKIDPNHEGAKVIKKY